VVLALLLLAQLASAYALVPGHRGSGAGAPAAHCASQSGHSTPMDGSSCSGNCCEQPAGCHCPQVPALQHLDALVSDAFADAAPPARLRAPPLLLRTEELFRPPI
jgi:hypothetical protein